MSTLGTELKEAAARGVTIDRRHLVVELSDGRAISVPVAWFPRLLHGTTGERGNWRLIGSGEGIHWPDLDEDISVASLLAGRQSGESAESFQAWLSARK
jgi:hypothetical protein